MNERYKYLLRILIIFFCGSLISACNAINPKEQVPTYIHVDSFTFVANPLAGSITLSHNITQVWAYYNNAPIGQFDLPATIPVRTNGDSAVGQLQLAPGIAVNGLNNLLASYPFYQLDTFSFKAQPGTIIQHNPVTSYYSAAKFTTIADFESAINFSLWIGNIPMVITTDPALVFQGHGSGSITLINPGDSSIDSSTTTPFPIPAGSAYIEFDYKSQIPFYVGLQALLGSTAISSQPYFLAGIKPSDHWQKFYLAVADFNAQVKGTAYRLYFKAADNATGQLLLDNIQLVNY